MALPFAQRAAEEAARKANEKRDQLTGLENAGRLRDYADRSFWDIRNREAPQAGNVTIGDIYRGQAATIDPRQQAEWRARQMAMTGRLEGIASGQQMGAGELAAMRQGGRAQAQQIGMARMQRGGNAALAARSAATNAGNIGLATAGQAQQAALQDQAAANQTLGQLLSQGRAQDIGLATDQARMRQEMNLANMSAENQRIFQQAGLDQATSLANMQARLSTMGMNDSAQLAYLSMLFGIDQTELQARLQYEQIVMAKKAQEQQSGMLGGLNAGSLLQLGGQLGAAYLGMPSSPTNYSGPGTYQNGVRIG